MPPVPEILDHLGNVRKLAYVAPDLSKVKMRGTTTNIQTIRSNNGMSPLIASSDYQPVDYVTGYPSGLINDQGQEGACTAASDCGAYQRQFYIRNCQIISLSWQFVYDQINGGQDNGSNIIDSMGVMEGMGTPLMSLYPKSLWVPNKVPPGAAMYKEDVPVTISTSQEAATALLMGMFVQAPILVTNNFEQFTSDGIAWNGKAPRSNQSNHSIYLAGIKQINGVWCFILVNSWGATWGPWKNGACYIPFSAIDNPSQANDGYCHASIVNPTQSIAA